MDGNVKLFVIVRWAAIFCLICWPHYPCPLGSDNSISLAIELHIMCLHLPSSDPHVGSAPLINGFCVFISLINGTAVEDDDNEFAIHDSIGGAEAWSGSGGDSSFDSDALSKLVKMFVGVFPLDFPT